MTTTYKRGSDEQKVGCQYCKNAEPIFFEWKKPKERKLAQEQLDFFKDTNLVF